jgi:uncharacterized protein YcbX
LHLLTTASQAALGARNPAARFDVRRFRPNLLIDTAATEGLVENEWCGKMLRIASARIKVEIPCVRCVMPTLPQADLPKDPSVLRTIVRDAAQNFGAYATVTSPARLTVGDEVELL